MDLIRSAILKMAHSVAGGHVAAAAALGLCSKAALENRLYQVKGQRVSIEEAMMLQIISNRTDFAQAVAFESGGVFVEMPDLDAAALQGEDILNSFLNVFVQMGELVKQYQLAEADGNVDADERAVIWQQIRELTQVLYALGVNIDRVFGVENE